MLKKIQINHIYGMHLKILPDLCQKVVNIAAGHHALDIDKSLGFGLYEALNNMALHDSYMAPPVAGGHPLATDPKPTNPFDLPYDSEIESGNTLWGMGYLRAALPNDPMPTSYVDGVSSSWLPQNPGASYVPGGVTFDSPSGSLGFMAGQMQISNVSARGPVASIGGNPFA